MKLIIFIFFIICCYGIIPTYILKIITKIRRITKKNNENNIYLTFDDGPSSKYTLELLELLEKYNVKATFFIVAKFAIENKDIIQKMKEDGHSIQLHSLEHKNELIESPINTIKDINESIKIMSTLGIKVKYFRAPWGHFNIVSIILLIKNKIKIILWNVMAEDWEADTTEEIISMKLIKRVKKGDIICLHDGRGFNEAPSRTIKALEKTIPIWISKGFNFDTMDGYNG